jgi:putative ABC transport system permease protein
LDTLRQDVRFAWRSLRRQPAFVAVAVATLTLGIGTTTAMFTIVNGVLIQPLPFHEPAALGVLRIQDKRGNSFPLPDADFLALRAHHPAFARLAVFADTTFNLTGTGDPEVVRARWVSGEFFSTLGLQPRIGRVFVAQDDAPGAAAQVVLGDGFWARRFGRDPSVIGKTLRLNDVPCTVIGVAPAGMALRTREPDMFRNRIIEQPPRRGPFYLTGITRLDPNAGPEAARTNLDAVRGSILQQYGGAADWTFHVVPLTEALVGPVRTPLYMLLSAVGLLLLIALANVANLLLARSTSRQREVALRAALGAGRGRIVRQLLTESALLSAAGCVLGVGLATGLTRMLLTRGQFRIPRLGDATIDGYVLAFAAGLSILAGVVFGVGPALHASRGDLTEALRDGVRAGTTRSRRRLQRGLVVAEIALALVLSVGAGLLVRSLMRLQQVNPGFDSDRLLTFSVDLPRARYPNPGAIRVFYERLSEAIAAVPGVHSAAVAVSLPPDQVTVTDNFTAEGKTYAVGESAPVGTMMVVSDAYFETLAVPLINGRLFDRRDAPGGDPVVIVSQTLAERYYPNGDAVGRKFRIGGPERPTNSWMQVVGIVADVKYNGLSNPAEPAYYLPFRQHSWSGQYIAVRSALAPMAVLPSIKQAVWSIDRDLPLARVRTMDQIMSEGSADPRFRTFVLACFGALGLLLALVGVYGVMSYAVAQRAHELGVRAALGARRGDLLALVLHDAARLAALGVVIGLAGAMAATSALERLLFGVTPKDPWTFGAVAFLVAWAALLASWIPARRAARADPLAAMREQT